MIEIKQLDSNNKELFDIFHNFCIKSKPYDFCSLKSSSLRSFKIKEYYNEVSKNCKIYSYYEENNWILFLFISEEEDYLALDFIMCNNTYSPTIIIDRIRHILLYLLKIFDKQCVRSIIQRKYKKQKYINWIKRYDKSCEIDENDNVIWTYERLNQNYRDKSRDEIIKR
jgi:hypothetical protein